MSWSISLIGTPENVSEALDKHSEGLTGVSKEEFDAALPNIKGLIAMNYNSQYPTAIKVSGNGHAWSDTTNKYGNCSISIGFVDGQLV